MTTDARPALMVVLVAAVGGLIASSFIDPVYRARATIWLEKGSVGELIRSKEVVDSAVRAYGLYLSPAEGADHSLFREARVGERFMPGDYTLTIDAPGARWRLEVAEQGMADSGGAGDSIGRIMGLRWKPSAASLTRLAGTQQHFTVNTPREVSADLRSDLIANQPQGSRFVSLAYNDADPAYAARALNAVANHYAAIANARGLGPVIVLDSAVAPVRPFRNSRANVIAKAVLFGVGLGICLIMVQAVRAGGLLATPDGPPQNENRSIPVP